MLQPLPFSLNDIIYLNLSIVWKVAAPPQRGNDRRTIKSHHLDLEDCLIAATCVINKARAAHWWLSSIISRKILPADDCRVEQHDGFREVAILYLPLCVAGSQPIFEAY